MIEQGILTDSNQKLENVWKQNATQIYKLCASRSNDLVSADDLFQDVALKFCKNANSLDLDEPMIPWFAIVVKHSHYDLYKRSLRETPFSLLSDNQESYDVFPASSAIHFNDDVRQIQVENDLKLLMSELTDLERLAVNLSYIEGISLESIGASQHLSRRALSRKRQVAIQKMQEKYRKNRR